MLFLSVKRLNTHFFKYVLIAKDCQAAALSHLVNLGLLHRSECFYTVTLTNTHYYEGVKHTQYRQPMFSVVAH